MSVQVGILSKRQAVQMLQLLLRDDPDLLKRLRCYGNPASVCKSRSKREIIAAGAIAALYSHFTVHEQPLTCAL
eukprot:SAG31_NODE_929_length_10926_cov_8.162834_10_plen_74_part_00